MTDNEKLLREAIFSFNGRIAEELTKDDLIGLVLFLKKRMDDLEKHIQSLNQLI